MIGCVTVTVMILFVLHIIWLAFLRVIRFTIRITKRFCLRRWLDWKYRNAIWIVAHTESQTDEIIWSIAKHFGFPIIHPTSARWWHLPFERTLFELSKDLPNKILYSTHDGVNAQIFIVTPRSGGDDEKAPSKTFELADPKFFDQITEWLQHERRKRN